MMKQKAIVCSMQTYLARQHGRKEAQKPIGGDERHVAVQVLQMCS